MSRRIDDVRIKSVRPLLPAAILHEEIPVSPQGKKIVSDARTAIENSLKRDDDRLVVVIGPCSVHDPKSALEYGHSLKKVSLRLKNDLIIVMRTYFEKPRTTVGWKGLVNDPFLDGTYRVNEGLRMARKLLRDLAEIGLPCAMEFLDTSFPQHLADLISWGAIGARTTESQVHREMASGLSMPIGFKNATDGGIRVAIDSILAARSSHWFAGATKDGVSALIQTSGNENCHLILRGGTQSGPNFDSAHVAEASKLLKKEGLPNRIMVDLSHGNSQKNYLLQLKTGADVGGQIASGSASIFGVMIESHLVEGNQDIHANPMVYGQSITDSCLSFKQTEPLLELLANSVRTSRRKH